MRTTVIPLFAVVLTIIAACGKQRAADSIKKTVSSKKQDSTLQTYSEIYSEIVNGDSSIQTERSLVRIYSEYVSWDTISLLSQLKEAGVEPETIENFGNTVQSVPIDSLQFDLRVMSVVYYKNPGKMPEFNWGMLPNQYFDQVRTIGFSKIGLNKNGRQAVVYVEVGGFGNRFGSGTTVLLSKRDGKWKKEKTIGGWTI